MKFKRIGYVLLVIVACMLMITACGKGGDGKTPHTHSYTSTVTAPTCTEKGFTKHVCSCGHSYVDTYVDATGKHAYTTKIVQYPAANTEGKRELTCSVCGSKVEEAIEAFNLSLPNISETAHALLAGAKYTLDASDSELILVTETDGEETGSESIVLKLAEAVIDGSGDVLAGYIKLEIGLTSEAGGIADTEKEASCYIYVNGEDVSVEVTPVDGEKDEFDIKLDETLYETLFDAIGVDQDAIASGSFIATELQKYVPILEALAEKLPVISEDFIASINEIAALVGSNIVVTETVGVNTVQTVDLAALKEFLAIVDGKTVSELLDDIYGEGTGAAALAFITSIPDKKIGDIVDAAIALTENYEIPVEDTYFLVNFLVYMATESMEFNIEDEINKNYDKTIADLIAEDTGVEDKEAYKNDFKTNLTGMAQMILGSTIDELYIMYFAVDAEEEFSLIENIGALIDMMAEAVAIEIVTDENGVLVSLNFAITAGGTEIIFSVFEDGELVRIVADVVADADDLLDFKAVFDPTSGALETGTIIRNYVYSEETDEYNLEVVSEIATTLAVTEDGQKLSFAISDGESILLAGTYLVSVTADEESVWETVAVVIEADGETVMDVAYTLEYFGDESEQGIALYYNIERFVVSIAESGEIDSEATTKVVEALCGMGAIAFTVNP